jgi:hypothetical protein
METEFQFVDVSHNSRRTTLILEHQIEGLPKTLPGEFMKVRGTLYGLAFLGNAPRVRTDYLFIVGTKVVRLDHKFRCSLQRGLLKNRFQFELASVNQTVVYTSFFRRVFADPSDPFHGDIFEWVNSICEGN